ncbi:acetyltransferase [Cryobacterium sp. Sr3]|uniref:acetyltransferase n=1 Tax=Cryobacterium sp. Sr3 TaxID=1259194 RepID=UPI0010692CF5|nr:acetyltransferase [Cryobacterium sp. Sr3]TFB55269.1 acetyltransferase [Cryobacterium sp. Sr3]
MSTPLIVVGAGGFGRETLDVVEAINRSVSEPTFDLLGVVDANPSPRNLARLAARGIRYLGTEGEWLIAGVCAEYLVGIGNPAVRQRVDAAFTSAGLTAATAVHPAATVGSAVTIGEGSIVCVGVQVSTNVSVGRHVHLNANTTIGHDANLNDYVSVNPSATISGEVAVGTGALIGAGAVVLQGITIGAGALVGASSCVVRDVADGTTVMGVPAR